jgi:hypothetical protein
MEKELMALKQPGPSGPDILLPLEEPETPSDHQDILRQNIDLLTRHIREKSKEIDELGNTRTQVETYARERVAELEEQMQREIEINQRLRTQLIELEQTHLDLLKAYREMNSRMIQMQGPLPVAPKPETAPPSRSAEPSSKPTPLRKPKVRLNR